MTDITKQIHNNASIHESAFIGHHVIIGKGVSIEKNAYISHRVSIYGKTKISEGAYIGENCIIGHPLRTLLNEIIKNKVDISEVEGPKIEIGRKNIIRAGSIIYNGVQIAEKCQTGHNIMVRENTTIGKNTLLGTGCIIDGNVNIGNNVSIQTGVYIPVNCKIGNHVFLGPYCKLTNDKYMMRKTYDLVGPTIEDYVSVGCNSVILPGIILKKGSIIGAGSVVTKDTDEKGIYVGNPAKKLKEVPIDWNIP